MIEEIDRLLAVFDEYPRDECADFIAALLLETGTDLALLEPSAQQMMVDFAVRAGMVPGASAEETAAALREYFAAHPLNPELVRVFKGTMRAEVLLKDPGLLARSASRWVAAEEKKIFQSRDEPPPKEAVGRGQLGFFAAKKKLEPEKKKKPVKKKRP